MRLAYQRHVDFLDLQVGLKERGLSLETSGVSVDNSEGRRISHGKATVQKVRPGCSGEWRGRVGQILRPL